MAKIFISYSQASKDVIEELVLDLTSDDHEIWFDQHLTGGQKWWDNILSEIRECEIFVVALTPDSLESRACQREAKYASDLKRTLLPVRLSDKVSPESLPPDLSDLQWVDYSLRNVEAFKSLQRTLRHLPKAPLLPEPLPDAPAVPISYLSNLRAKIESASQLPAQDQIQLVFELRSQFLNGDPAEEVIDLLQRLQKRADLFAVVAQYINQVLREIDGRRSGEELLESPTRPGPATSPVVNSPVPPFEPPVFNPWVASVLPKEASLGQILGQIIGGASGESAKHKRLRRTDGVDHAATPGQGKYIVWYATNRRPNDPIDPNKGFSAERDRTVHYGSCRVFIPKSHKIGSTGSPWWKRILTRTDDRLKLLETKSLEAATFWQGVAMHFTNIAQDDNSGVVLLHGYNVSFPDAALRAAQIGFDLQIKGAMAFFSWPSQGALDGYSADEATIEASEDIIAEFLVDFAAKSGASKVHVIAHSMGNRGLLRAVNRIVSMAEQRSQKQFDQIILAAADVDADVFRRDSGAYAKIARRTTLYVSSRDRAVEASRWLHNYPRAGLMPPILIVPGIDTINVVNVDLTMLGHGYIAEARAVLTDIYHLFKEGKAPGDRFGIAAITSRQNEAYWEIRG